MSRGDSDRTDPGFHGEVEAGEPDCALDELLRMVTNENIHSEADWGRDVGLEVF